MSKKNTSAMTVPPQADVKQTETTPVDPNMLQAEHLKVVTEKVKEVATKFLTGAKLAIGTEYSSGAGNATGTIGVKLMLPADVLEAFEAAVREAHPKGSLITSVGAYSGVKVEVVAVDQAGNALNPTRLSFEKLAGTGDFAELKPEWLDKPFLSSAINPQFGNYWYVVTGLSPNSKKPVRAVCLDKESDNTEHVYSFSIEDAVNAFTKTPKEVLTAEILARKPEAKVVEIPKEAPRSGKNKRAA